MKHLALSLLSAVSLLIVLSACTFSYYPLVPPAQAWEPIMDLSGSRGLSLVDDGLMLHLNLSEVPEPGWLAIQWFGPNRQQASESIWVTPDEIGRARLVYLPQDVPLTPGLWRAVLSFDAVVARQFSLTVD